MKDLCDEDVISYFFDFGAIETRNSKESRNVVDAFFNTVDLPLASIWDLKVS